MFKGINLLYHNSIFVKNYRTSKNISIIFFQSFINRHKGFNFSFFNSVYMLKDRLFFIPSFISLTLFNFFFRMSFLFFYARFFVFRIFKAHGINMRLLRKSNSGKFFLRAGFSHGVFFNRSNSFLVKIFKKRYFIIYGFDNRLFENFAFHLRYLRRFFKYKLIGIKAQRDTFRIKVGKKKTF